VVVRAEEAVGLERIEPVAVEAGAIVTVAVIVTVTMLPAAGIDEPVAAGTLALDAEPVADAEETIGMMSTDDVEIDPILAPGICRTSPTLIWNEGPCTCGFAASNASNVTPFACAIADI
jgi:hypothetical protein